MDVTWLETLAGLLTDLEESQGAGAYGMLVLILVLGACLVPIPEEAAFAIGGALAARGVLSLPVVYLVGWSTVFVLDVVLYTIGRAAGHDIEQTRLGRRVSPQRWARLRRFMDAWGVWAVVAARFVMGTRIPTFLLAGALEMPRARFCLAVGLAGLCSAGLPLALGYVFGEHLDRLLEILAASRWILLGAVVVALVVWWWVRRRA